MFGFLFTPTVLRAAAWTAAAVGATYLIPEKAPNSNEKTLEQKLLIISAVAGLAVSGLTIYQFLKRKK